MPFDPQAFLSKYKSGQSANDADVSVLSLTKEAANPSPLSKVQAGFNPDVFVSKYSPQPIEEAPVSEQTTQPEMGSSERALRGLRSVIVPGMIGEAASATGSMLGGMAAEYFNPDLPHDDTYKAFKRAFQSEKERDAQAEEEGGVIYRSAQFLGLLPSIMGISSAAVGRAAGSLLPKATTFGGKAIQYGIEGAAGLGTFEAEKALSEGKSPSKIGEKALGGALTGAVLGPVAAGIESGFKASAPYTSKAYDIFKSTVKSAFSKIQGIEKNTVETLADDMPAYLAAEKTPQSVRMQNAITGFKKAKNDFIMAKEKEIDSIVGNSHVRPKQFQQMIDSIDSEIGTIKSFPVRNPNDMDAIKSLNDLKQTWIDSAKDKAQTKIQELLVKKESLGAMDHAGKRAIDEQINKLTTNPMSDITLTGYEWNQFKKSLQTFADENGAFEGGNKYPFANVLYRLQDKAKRVVESFAGRVGENNPITKLNEDIINLHSTIRNTSRILSKKAITEEEMSQVLGKAFSVKGDIALPNMEKLDQMIGSNLVKQSRIERSIYDLNRNADGASNAMRKLSDTIRKTSLATAASGAGAAAGAVVGGPAGAAVGASIMAPLIIAQQSPAATKLLLRGAIWASRKFEDGMFNTIRRDVSQLIADGDTNLAQLFPIPKKILSANNIKAAMFTWLGSYEGRKSLQNISGLAQEKKDDLRARLGGQPSQPENIKPEVNAQ